MFAYILVPEGTYRDHTQGIGCYVVIAPNAQDAIAAAASLDTQLYAPIWEVQDTLLTNETIPRVVWGFFQRHNYR